MVPYCRKVRSPDSDVEAWSTHPRWDEVPPLDLHDGAGPCERLVVVAAHPDDESLGAGGLIATAHAAGLPIYLLLLTAGEASHAGAAGRTRHALATLRLDEMKCAVEELAPGTPVVFLGADDGEVVASEEAIAASLTEVIGNGQRTVVAAPWRHDNHPDHAAAGRAAAAACASSGARLLEYPVRLWLDQHPDEAPWDKMVRLELSEEERERKTAAIHCHASQVRPAGEESEAGVNGRRLHHFTGPAEHFVEEPDAGAGPGEGDVEGTEAVTAARGGAQPT